MKSYLKFSFGIFLMVAITDMHAQIKSGYKIGLNLSTMTLKSSGKSIEPKTMTGVHLGSIFGIHLKSNFALEPGLLFSAKGL